MLHNLVISLTVAVAKHPQRKTFHKHIIKRQANNRISRKADSSHKQGAVDTKARRGQTAYNFSKSIEKMVTQDWTRCTKHLGSHKLCRHRRLSSFKEAYYC
ncbi:hypothetical protein BpHYR1_002636 [Brachionus plicatilis]|uniref:Uncharacterized protein n=1 Tax=Brachionus plicatilis TaxID=10195 RepID=A0A3M7QRI8_BRAPC|nr:hypothetical protein BpHYR1_002636 [Brachionus plicatilis]